MSAVDGPNELADVLHDLQLLVGDGYTTAASAAAEAVRRVSVSEAEVARLRDELEDAAAPVDDLREQLTAARRRAERFQDERDSARDALAEVVAERDAARQTAERWRYVQSRARAAKELSEVMARAVRKIRAQPTRDIARDQVDRVRNLHRAHNCGDTGCPQHGYCITCDVAHPCPTVQALDGTPPPRRTEQDGGIPNDAYTADDYPKGM